MSSPRKRGSIKFHAVFFSILLLFSFGFSSFGVEFYVAPNGQDTNPGTKESPFATIQKAREAVRAINRNSEGDIRVYLRQGIYRQTSTLKFEKADSGTNNHNVIYSSFSGEQAIISGGKPITGWSPAGNGIYKALAGASMSFRQLFVNGRYATRARQPNEWKYYRIKSWTDPQNTQAEKAKASIVVNTSETASWSNLNQIEIITNLHWDQHNIRIAGFRQNGADTLVLPQDPDSQSLSMRFPLRTAGQTYFFENAREFLDEPGEWYYDTASGELFYMPHVARGEDMLTAEVIIPVLDRLIEITNAENIKFENLVFEHTTWTQPSREGYAGLQAGIFFSGKKGYQGIPAGIFLDSSKNIVFNRNELRNMGTTAIQMSNTNHTVFNGNFVYSIAGNGVMITPGSADINTDCMSMNVITNNCITHIGHDYTGCVGILATYSAGLTIEHNEIWECPYTGISVGWGWTARESCLKNNSISFNSVHSVMLLHDDGAGIYTLSNQPGTTLRGNYIYGISRSRWADDFPVAGIYFDEGSSNITAIDNVISVIDTLFLEDGQIHKTVEKIHKNKAGNIIEINNNSQDQSIMDAAGPLHGYRRALFKN